MTNAMNNVLKHNIIDQFGGCAQSERVFDVVYSQTLDWREAEKVAQKFHCLSRQISRLLEIAASVNNYSIHGLTEDKLADLHQFIMTRAFNSMGRAK